jgi:hypothetical protein
MTLDELLKRKNRMARPPIVVHCGSTNRALHYFEVWRVRDALAGYKVFTIGAAKSDKDLGITPQQAIHLDILHLFKIDDADLVRIFNPGGYLGESTRREVEYARRLKKPIWWLEPPGEDIDLL